MLKKVLALALSGVAFGAASGPSFAQSNVSIYGLLDIGYNEVHTDGASTARSVDSSQLSGSRLGFKGTEDLGNGLKALFVLEYALANDVNSSLGSASKWSASASRQTYAGLANEYGTLTMGRLQTAAFNWACAYSPLTGGIFATDLRLGARTYNECGNNGRADNAIGYVSPTLGGFTLAANHIRRTENANKDGNDDTANMLGLTYQAGALQVGLVYNDVTRNKTTAANQTTDADIREYGIGASYDFQVVKLFASYANNKVDGQKAESKYQLGASVPVSAKGQILASYAENNLIGDDTDTRIWSAAYNHNMSKRTTLYAGYGRLDNEDKANRGMGAPGYPLPPLGGKSSIVGLGMRHAF